MNGYIIYIFFVTIIFRTYEKNIATYQCKLIGLYIKHLNFCFRDYGIGFTFEIQHTVNPLLSPPEAYLFQTVTFEGGLIETGGLFDLAKTMAVVSVLRKELE